MQVRDKVAKPGQKVKGLVQIGQTSCGPIQFPLVIINGESPGPVLCLTAGVHATEYSPIDAVLRLINELTPGRLRGTVVAVPVVSMAMFASRTGFVSPLDGLNLNKIAPGNPNGTSSEMLAHALLEEVIGKAQYHIDLHGGDFGEMLWPFAGYPLTGNAEGDREGEALARVFTPQMISLAPEGGTIPPFPGSIVYEAARRGVVSILAEAGGNGTLEEADTRVHLDGVRNVMRYLGMIEGEPRTAAALIAATDRFITRATQPGLLRLKVAIGDKVGAGQEVAEICDVYGETVESVRVVRAGIAGLVWAHKAVNTGDPIVRCWVTEPARPFAPTDRFLRSG